MKLNKTLDPLNDPRLLLCIILMLGLVVLQMASQR